MKQLIGAFVCAFVLTSSNAQTGYWQQELKYKISVTLNDQDHSLDAFEQIVYTNHSPDTLRFIWFHLWPNAFKNDKTAYSEQMLQNGDTHFYFGGKEDRGYINRLDFRVDDVAAKLEDHPQDIDIVKLILPKPLPPQQSITITTPFHVQLPGISSRGGHHGQSYQITQWYPKPAVYDRKGWHPMPYLDQGEFFSEFGSFDVQITLPKNYTVAATGDLQNAEEKEWLLSRKNIPAPASNQGKKKPAKLGEKKLKKEDQFPPSDRVTKTLRYYQERVHDFAWFADKRWLVNHATMQLSSGKPIDLYAFYPPWQAKNWSTSLDMLRDAVQKRSAWLGEYPYSTISIVQGYSTGGMEYPTLSIIRGYSNTKDLDLTIEHEAGHNWLYGILGSNERDHPWMDEGMNTYYDNRYSEIKFPDTKKTGGGLFGDLSSEKMDRIVYQTLIAEKLDQPISTSSEAFTVDNYNYVGYTKTGDWMKLLEMQLGQPLFDSCMHAYYQAWQFKHPYPEDFKATIDRVSGRNNDSIFNLLNETGTLYPKTKKKLKLAPLVRFNTDPQHTNYLFVAPSLGYNTYDGVMVGALIHNYTLPTQPFQYLFAPMYATKSKSFSGLGMLNYALFPSQLFQRVDFGITGSYFSRDSYTDSAGRSTFFHYLRFVPQVKLVYKKKNPRSTITHAMQFKIFLLREEQIHFEEDTVTHGDLVTKNHSDNGIGLLRYTVNNDRALYPYTADLQFESAADFGKISFNGTYFFNFRKSGGVKVRLFAGKFFYYVSKTANTQFNNERYHLNLTGPNGDEDYTYSNYFLGRSEFQGLPSQQIMQRDGFFKVRTDLLGAKVGKTDDWLSTLNFTLDVPNRLNPLSILPLKIPLKLFLDVGTYNEVWKKGSTDPRFLYDAGFQLSLFQDMLNIYVPLFYSGTYKDYYHSHPEISFWQRISFSIDFQNARLRKLLNLPAW